MHLYLSSYGVGNKGSQLYSLCLNKKIAFIANALDFSQDEARKQASIERSMQELIGLGLEPELVDLRNYFDNETELVKKLKGFGGVWVRGGNSFVLRKAMRYSGLDTILFELKSDSK